MVETILNEVHISNLFFGVVSINLDYSVVLVIGEMEVDSSQYLSELFGSDLLVGMSVPVLEETLYVQSGGDTEGVESLLQLLDHTDLVLGGLASAVVVVKRWLPSHLTGVLLLQPLDLEHLIDSVAEPPPVHHQSAQTVLIDQDLELAI